MIKKKILLLCYQISPTRGSEYSVAWNYVTEMSKHIKITVLYGTSGNHMGDFENFDFHLNENIKNNVRFIPIKPNIFARAINQINKKKILSYTFYFAYRIWNWQVYNVTKKLIQHEEFDLIHFLNPIGYREPGYLWRIDLPYIWGPISGTSNRPIQLFKMLSLKEFVIFHLLNQINTFQFKHNNRLKKALENTDLLLTATKENQSRIKSHYNKSSIYLPENAIINIFPQKSISKENIYPETSINILWIGRIDANKSLDILINSLAIIDAKNWHLHVIGDGPKMNRMLALSSKLSINDKITWYGHISRSHVFKLLEKGHLNIITSLSEGNPTTIWEAMSYGIPTITLNHCGMKDVICTKCGIKIDVSSYEQVTKDMATTLNDLLSHPQKIIQLSNGSVKCAQNFTWEKRSSLFNKFYRIAIKIWKEKKTK